MIKPDAYDPTLSRTDIKYILENVYHADPDDFGFSEMCNDDLRNLLDSYIRGVQQQIDAVCEEE